MIEEMAGKIHWLGHDAFRIDAEKTLYFDPYQVSSGPTAALIMIRLQSGPSAASPGGAPAAVAYRCPGFR